jgi:hypothetical protein
VDRLWCDNYLRHSREAAYKMGLQLLTVLLEGQHLIDILTSNQVGLPAELKHINKRRKRN